MADYIRDPAKFGTTDSAAEPPVKLTATEARQGYLGRPVLIVLVAGLFLALIAWGAAEFFGNAIEPASESAEPAAVPSANDPATIDPADNDTIINDNQPAGEDVQPTPGVQDSNRL
jgi:hypothetical protein